MKESYSEGLATQTGPESCGGDSNVMAEALTGVNTGQVLSRENEFKVRTLWDGLPKLNPECRLQSSFLSRAFGLASVDETEDHFVFDCRRLS